MKKRTRRMALVLAATLLLAFMAGCGQNAPSQEAPVASVSVSGGVQAQSEEATAQGDAAPSGELQVSDATYETLHSLEKVTDNFYQMEYTADYALDDLLAQGAADGYELGAFVSAQMLEGLPFHQQVPDLACSSFTAITPNGDYIMGRNLDIADAQNTLVHTKPQNGYASLSVASGILLGYIGSMPDNLMGQMLLMAAPYYPVDGINEKGLSVAVLLQYAAPPINQDTGKTSITTTMAVRMLLDKAATVEEAIELMGQYDMHGIAGSNFHFQIADASGDSAVIEYVNAEMRVLRSEGNGQVVTNYFLSPDVVEDYRDGEDRLIALQAALDEGEGVVTEEKAMQMLDGVKAVHDYDELSGIDFNTSYSIVFNNTQRTMQVCANMDYGTVYDFAV